MFPPVIISVPPANSQAAVGVFVSPLMVLLTAHLRVYCVPASGGAGTVVATEVLLGGTVEMCDTSIVLISSCVSYRYITTITEITVTSRIIHL